MAVVLRMARHGQRNRPYYRIVASEKTSKRDGRYIEILGSYNPLIDPPAVTLKEDRIKHWVGMGAKPSDLVRALIVKGIPGLVEPREQHKLDKIRAARKARKERQKKLSSKGKKK